MLTNLKLKLNISRVLTPPKISEAEHPLLLPLITPLKPGGNWPYQHQRNYTDKLINKILKKIKISRVITPQNLTIGLTKNINLFKNVVPKILFIVTQFY